MATLYLWKIERTDSAGYDQYDSAVVVARTEADARQIHPDGDPGAHDWRYGGTWTQDVGALSVTKLGTAAKELAAGTVVLASFNAG